MKPQSTKGSWATSSIWSFLILIFYDLIIKEKEKKICIKTIQQVYLVWFDMVWFVNLVSQYFFNDNGST